ncbi:MAG: hypothetical protein PF518_01455 [Spirochaetaceae bacterium]|jgi:hypothetical protein|nr:hypothetical protein [Spirochaetaceae bacterium]
MKKIILFTIIAFIIASPVLAQESEKRTLESLIPSLTAEEKLDLDDDNTVYRYGRTRTGLYYTPMVPLADKIVDRFNSIEPDVTVEALFKVPYPADLPDGHDRDMIFYNILREVSKISGVQYFSRTKNKYRILFEDVYAIDERKKPIDDPLVWTIPEYDSFPIHMKEANLGRDYYLAEYNYDGQDMTFSLTNTSNMSFILRVVGKEEMQIDLLLMPLENEVLIYGYCGVKLSNSGLVFRMMDPFSSFYRRLLAMEIWFSNTLHNSDVLPEKSLQGIGRE